MEAGGDRFGPLMEKEQKLLMFQNVTLYRVAGKNMHERTWARHKNLYYYHFESKAGSEAVRRTDRLTDRQTDGRTDRQAETDVGRQINRTNERTETKTVQNITWLTYFTICGCPSIFLITRSLKQVQSQQSVETFH